jgi:hypothetical protein
MAGRKTIDARPRAGRIPNITPAGSNKPGISSIFNWPGIAFRHLDTDVTVLQRQPLTTFRSDGGTRLIETPQSRERRLQQNTAESGHTQFETANM